MTTLETVMDLFEVTAKEVEKEAGIPRNQLKALATSSEKWRNMPVETRNSIAQVCGIDARWFAPINQHTLDGVLDEITKVEMEIDDEALVNEVKELVRTILVNSPAEAIKAIHV